jgi:hypothetical protein
MPTIVAAAESQVLLDGQPVEGVRAIEYRTQHGRSSVYALGSTERIGIVAGPQIVEGRLRVASTSPALAALAADTAFQLTAELKHGATTVTVTFDECFLTERGFSLAVGEFGEAVYGFTATRIVETVS